MRSLDTEFARPELEGQTPRERLLSLQLEAARKRRQTAAKIGPRGHWDGPVPVSYAQERLWFLDQMGLVGAAYNVPLALSLSGELNEAALEQSFSEVVRRHENLRTRFAMQDGVPQQIIEPPGPFQLQRVNLSNVPDPQERERQLRELMQLEQLHQFDLSKGPLIRVSLVTLGSREHELLITMHHIVADGWSLGIIVRELGALYAAYVKGQVSPLPDLAIQYADYAIWQRQWLQGDTLKEQLQYWGQKLSGAPPQLQLPTDKPRPPTMTFQGALFKFHIPATVSRGLEELARREGATLFMAALAAFQLLLSR